MWPRSTAFLFGRSSSEANWTDIRSSAPNAATVSRICTSAMEAPMSRGKVEITTAAIRQHSLNDIRKAVRVRAIFCTIVDRRSASALRTKVASAANFDVSEPVLLSVLSNHPTSLESIAAIDSKKNKNAVKTCVIPSANRGASMPASHSGAFSLSKSHNVGAEDEVFSTDFSSHGCSFLGVKGVNPFSSFSLLGNPPKPESPILFPAFSDTCRLTRDAYSPSLDISSNFLPLSDLSEPLKPSLIMLKMFVAAARPLAMAARFGAACPRALKRRKHFSFSVTDKKSHATHSQFPTDSKDTYNPLKMTFMIVVNAFPPFVSLCLTRMLAYQRSKAQAQNRRP
nr:hypothetical protein Iba_scaffold34358CG0050 [Ipomoea batatas]